MSSFNYYQPTEIVFGRGRVDEVGDIAKKYGDNCLLVSVEEFDAIAPLYKRVKESLKKAGVKYAHFDGVLPNPTTDIVSDGAKMASNINADVVIGLGGGSSMDTAKAIAVEVTHKGTAWDYLFYKKEPTTKTLPIIAVSTTSGTGSQTTPCAVITKTENHDKSAIWHPNIFAKVAIVDPELMLTVPKTITAQTGFDAFAHNFEAFISNGTNLYVETLAIEAIRKIIQFLPKAVNDTSDIDAREAMAWGDTLGGLAIASAGVTLPHGLGMQISGHCPHVSHGQSLAVTYPEFTRYTYTSAIKKFAIIGRLFNKELVNFSDELAAEKCCDEIDKFLKRIGLWIGFKDINVSKEEIKTISNAGQVLGDYKNNPKIATIDEMYKIMMASYERNCNGR